MHVRTLAAALLAVLAPSAQAAEIRGTLVAHPGFGEPARPTRGAHDDPRGYYWEVPNGIVPTAPFRIRYDEEATVTLEGSGLAPEPPGTVDVQLGNGSMLPQTVVVPPGTQVRFINHSGLTNILYSPGMATFGQEVLHTAHMRVVAFPTAGTFEVRCAIRPAFRGWVIVAPGIRGNRPSADGQFSFSDIPPGSFELKVLFRGQPVLSRTVQVGMEDVSLDQVAIGAPPRPAAPAAAPASPAAPEQDAQPHGRGRRRRGGRSAGAGAPAPAPASGPAPPPQPALAPGELRPHRLSGGP